MKNIIPSSVLAFLFLLIAISCNHTKKQYENIDYNVLQHSCEKALTDVIIHDIFTPPVASRIYAYCNLAYYEAVRFKDSVATSITSQMHGYNTMPLPEENKKYDFSLAALKAFFKVAKALTFSKDSLTVFETKLLAAFENSIDENSYQNSVAFGDSIAAVILQRSATDNYKQTRGMPKFSVFKENGKWQQTPPDYNDAVEPNWHLIKTMLIDSAAQFKPLPPPAYSLEKGSQYYKELMEMYNVSKNLTAQQDTIAQYWDDNAFVTKHEGHMVYANKKTTPGGHWMGIISILCKQKKCTEVATAKVYSLTAAAIYDGFISCWYEKYRSRMVRPITVIQEYIDTEWEPLLQTPPFPEYTSGHSVITAAAATVLTALLGENIAFTDTTELEYLGLQRSFNSIHQAADEAGISRMYGGIHYRSAIEQGRWQGKQVGNLYIAQFNKATQGLR